MTVEIKNKDVLLGLLQWQFHTILRNLIGWWVDNIGSLYVTEGYRKKKHSNDLHGTLPGRAIDARSRIYVKPDMVADKVNRVWVYDSNRPHMKCVYLHARCPECGHNNQAPWHKKCDKCRANITKNWHFHIQIHPRTKYVEIDTPEFRPNEKPEF